MSAHVLTGCMLLFATPQGGNSQPTPDAPSQLEEVMANVRAQPLGPGTVDDLALPEDLLRRLSDRILRRSFEDTFRIVVATPVPASVGATGAASAAPAASHAEDAPSTSPFRAILNVLALLAVCVLAVLAYFAWRARSRRKE